MFQRLNIQMEKRGYPSLKKQNYNDSIKVLKSNFLSMKSSKTEMDVGTHPTKSYKNKK